MAMAQSAFEIGLTPEPDRPLSVLEQQAAMQINGVYDGPLDGELGPATVAALTSVAERRGYAYLAGQPLPEDMNQFLYFSLAVALGGDGCEDC